MFVGRYSSPSPWRRFLWKQMERIVNTHTWSNAETWPWTPNANWHSLAWHLDLYGSGNTEGRGEDWRDRGRCLPLQSAFCLWQRSCAQYGCLNKTFTMAIPIDMPRMGESHRAPRPDEGILVVQRRITPASWWAIWSRSQTRHAHTSKTKWTQH